MRFLFFALFVLIHGCGCVGFAQVPQPNVSKVFEFIDSKDNYVKNPIARLNDKNITCVNATAVQSTSAGNKLKGYASWTIDASAQNGYCEFSLDAIRDPHGSNNIQMEFMGFVKGDGSLYKAQILDGASNVKVQTPVFSNNTDWRPFSAGYPGQASPKVRITQTEAGTAPAIQVGVYYGPATNIGTYTPPSDFGAVVSGAGAISLVTPVGSNILPGSATVSDTSLFTMALTGLTSTPKCTVGVNSGTSTVTPSAFISSVTSSSISVRTGTVPVGANPSLTKAAVDFTLSCTKTGADAPQTVIRPETPRTPNIVRYTSGSGTYTPTPGTKYIVVEMVGGGGGGSSGGSTAGTAATSGSSTTFGTSLLTANGGSFGVGLGAGGAGGGATINSPAVGQSSSGGSGTAYMGVQAGLAIAGSHGGNSCFGGGGGGGPYASTGAAGAASTGSGGGGGGGGTSANGGSGGGAGGCIKATIASPSSSYAYSVGAGGNAGTGGTGGNAGGAGGSGVIIITEYFSNDVNAIIAGSVYTKSPNQVLKQSALVECSSTSSVVASIGSWATISNISGNRCNISMSGFTQNPICMAVVNSVETTNSRTVHLNVTSPTAMSIGCVNQLGGATSACTNTQFYLDCAGF